MNHYLSSASLKSLAKGQLLGKYGTVVMACLLHYTCTFFVDFNIATMVNTSTIFGNIVFYILTLLSGLLNGVFLYGEAYMFMKIACNQHVTSHDLFYGFRNDTDKVLKVQFVITLIGLICSLPSLLLTKVMANSGDITLMVTFIVLYVISTAINVFFNLIFSQCYFLLLDFPDYTPKELFRTSYKLMKGSKGRLFYIELSFLPLYLLGMLSCCVGFLWVLPYFQAVKTNFYLDLIKKHPHTTT